MNLDITGGRILQELHEKLSFIDDWEVDPKDVVVFLDKKLGEGAFGEVYNGTVSGPYLTKHPVLPLSIKKAVCVPVAIKMLKCELCMICLRMMNAIYRVVVQILLSRTHALLYIESNTV